MIGGYVYESKRRRFATTALGLIFWLVYAISLEAVAEVAHRTDAELREAMIGTWETESTKVGYSKEFVMFNADGSRKAVGITNDRGSLGRTESEGMWHIRDGFLVQQVSKRTPPDPAVRMPFNLRAQIESIENGIVKLSDKNGDKGEMHRISHLPTLPPLVTSDTWAPTLSTAEVKKIAISAPQPDYPVDARRNRTQGRGIFRLNLAADGKVASIQVLKSTGSKILDDAAERALKQWRFKSSWVHKVNVPINFVVTRR